MATAKAVYGNCLRRSGERQKRKKEKAEKIAERISKKIYRSGNVNKGISVKSFRRMCKNDLILEEMVKEYLVVRLGFSIEQKRVKRHLCGGIITRYEENYLISSYPTSDIPFPCIYI